MEPLFGKSSKLSKLWINKSQRPRWYVRGVQFSVLGDRPAVVEMESNSGFLYLLYDSFSCRETMQRSPKTISRLPVVSCYIGQIELRDAIANGVTIVKSGLLDDRARDDVSNVSGVIERM